MSSEGKEESDSGNSTMSTIGMRERLRHFTWAWFTATMSTGGLSIALAKTPHRFNGLYAIGVIVFMFDVALFLLLCTAMTARAIIDPQRFKRSFAHPAEAPFFGSFWLSICVIIGATQVYGITQGPAAKWLIDTIRVLYWVYAGISIMNSVFQYWIIMQRTPARPIPLTPAWFLAGYPTMLTGTIATLIAPTQPPEHRISIIISGFAYQGFGFMISFVLIVMYIYNLMQNGLPPPPLRPGMFIPVGSVGFTIVVLIGQARAIPRDYGYFKTHSAAADTLQGVALFTSIFLWLFTFWLFAIAAVSCITVIPKMRFTLPWWGFVFPNVGFTLATVDIGTELESGGILWVASGMTILVVLIWLTTLVMCIHAVITKRILFPGKDEDKDM